MTFVRKEQKTLPPLWSSMLSSHNRPCSFSYRQPFMVMAATLQMHDCRREGTVLSGICKLLIWGNPWPTSWEKSQCNIVLCVTNYWDSIFLLSALSNFTMVVASQVLWYICTFAIGFSIGHWKPFVSDAENSFCLCSSPFVRHSKSTHWQITITQD